jgi:hypothetical protein
MAAVEPTQIDWSSATVDDGTLTVALDGKPSKEWADRVESVLERLDSHGGSGSWGAIEVTRKKVTVADVTDGSESDLRHLLESAVLQANADLAAPAEGESGDTERSDEDQRMTDAFRAFAPRDDDGDDAADAD